MGLDGVELVMEIEDEFGIRIPDEEASRTVTMADLFLLVCRLRNVGPGDNRPEDDAQLGAVFRDLGLPHTFSEADRLSDLVPLDRRHELWHRLEQARRPKLRSPIGCVGVIALIATGGVLGLAAGPNGAILGLLVGLIAALLLARRLRATSPRFPTGLATIDDLRVWWRPITASAEIWTKLVEIVADQVGAKKQEIRPETQLVADLKIGQ